MRRMIDLERVLRFLYSKKAENKGRREAVRVLNMVIRYVLELDAVTYTPPAVGHWIFRKTTYGFTWVCSRCHVPYSGAQSVLADPARFCPNCGSRMIIDEKEKKNAEYGNR